MSLRYAVQSLVAEIHVLRMAVDELREEVQWNNQNRRELMPTYGAHRRVASCSLDPIWPDFAVNPVPQETVTKLRAELPPRSNDGQRNSLAGQTLIAF
jgi:hypothetical protein